MYRLEDYPLSTHKTSSDPIGVARRSLNPYKDLTMHTETTRVLLEQLSSRKQLLFATPW